MHSELAKDRQARTKPSHSLPETSSRLLRSAGLLEQYSYVRSQLGPDTCILVAAKFENDSGVPLDKPTLFAALEQVVHAHAALACRLVSTGYNKFSTLSWVRLPIINFEEIVQFHDDDSRCLESVVEAQLLLPFDPASNRPLWRLTVLQDGFVVFAYDHAMGDGQSGLAFHLHLASALQELRLPAPPHSGRVVLSSPYTPLPPPLEDLISLPAPFIRVLHEVFQALNPFSRKKRSSTWTGTPVPGEAPALVAIRACILHLSPRECLRVIQRCRANHATLTGAIYALASHILAQLLGSRGNSSKQKYKAITVVTAVSLRPCTNIPAAVICNCVSSHLSVHRLPNTTSFASVAAFPWTAARRFSDALKREAPESPALIGVLKFIFGDNYVGFFRGQLGKKREDSLEISNLGHFPVQVRDRGSGSSQEKSGGSWLIRETVFAQANGIVGAALKVNATGTPDGGLGVCITWGEGAVDDHLARDFVEEFTSGLRELAEADETVPRYERRPAM